MWRKRVKSKQRGHREKILPSFPVLEEDALVKDEIAFLKRDGIKSEVESFGFLIEKFHFNMGLKTGLKYRNFVTWKEEERFKAML